MLQYILGILVKELVQALFKAGQDYAKLRTKKKEDKESVNAALKEKDPKARAARIGDLLR